MDLNIGRPKTIVVDGMIVEEDALRIAEAVQDYCSDLKVICLDPQQAGLDDPPFKIVERCSDGIWRPVFSCWTLDQRVLDRIKNADKYRGNDAVAEIERAEAIYKKEQHQRFVERRLEQIDLVASIMRSSKSSFTYKNEDGIMVTISEDRPVEYDRGRSHYS